MRNETQKVKLLYIAKMLYEETDEQHLLTGDRIVERLGEKGIVCERKSVYHDLNTLSEFGMDIVRSRKGAYLATRTFELPELKLLVDAVQSARFITESKSRELIGKLARLTNRQKAVGFTSQIVVHNRVKTMNESIYYNIDTIHEAIRDNKQIRFVYYRWNADKKLVCKKEDAYVTSPWFFEWEHDKYYLVGYDEQSAQMRHYRIDKMKSLQLLDVPRSGRKEYEAVDLSAYANQTFGMFGGEMATVRLLVDATLAGVMIDHFGTEIWMHKEATEERLSVVIDTVVSDRFFGWLFGFGDKLEIVEPYWVKERYLEMLRQVNARYEK